MVATPLISLQQSPFNPFFDIWCVMSSSTKPSSTNLPALASAAVVVTAEPIRHSPDDLGLEKNLRYFSAHSKQEPLRRTHPQVGTPQAAQSAPKIPDLLIEAHLSRELA
jgi:hypothetical protein